MIDVALLGFGNVGRSFARYLATSGEQQDFIVRIRGVADSSGWIWIDSQSQLDALLSHKESGAAISSFAPGRTVESQDVIPSLSGSGLSAIVESLPTNLVDGQPALSMLTTALSQGTNVVTVDKGPLVHGFRDLMQAAKAGESQLAFTGTTGVPTPVELSDERIIEIRGVLNGTTNYVLTEMQERSLRFGEAVARAQAAGIAEPDPSQDLTGWDTASKILILAKVLMGAETRLSEVSRLGIGPETERLIQEARKSGRVVRLIGRARIWQGKIRVSVAPKLIDSDSPFFCMSGTSKAAVFSTAEGGSFRSVARSGRDAIAQTILDDLTRMSIFQA
jgi:homoserine dehydrogenase